MNNGVATAELTEDLLQSLDLGESSPAPAEKPVETIEAKAEEAVEAPEQSAQPDETQEADDNEVFQYFNDLEKVLDVEDTTALYGLKLKLDDGDEPTVGELKDMAREHRKLQKELEELKAQPQQTLQQQQQPQLQPQPQPQQEPQYAPDLPQELQKMAVQLEALAMNEAQIDWEAEEKADPGAAALLRQRYADARTKVSGALQQGRQQYAYAQQQQQQQHLAAAQQELLKQIPEWQDAQVFETDRSGMHQTAARYGYTPQEVDAVQDPRALRVWRDYTQLLGKIERAKANMQEVKQKGDVRLRATNFRTSKARQLQELESKAKRSGDRRTIHAAEKALLQEAGFL